MDDEEFKKREKYRAERLADFVKTEAREMFVEARFELVVELLKYFEPEIRELVRQHKYKGV